MADCLTLKKSNCKNCYKCIRNCPVKSIKFSAGQAHIIGNECILCGHCFVVCPQGAKEIVDGTEKAKVLLQSEYPVFASLAPSFIANYPGVGIESMRSALEKLGFAGVEETAVGATIVKREYDRLLSEEKRDIVISSCCHSVNLLIQKYFPNCRRYLADVLSPMQAHCLDIKNRHPGARTVFIGPCVAKKDEAEHYEGITDAVLTFEELTKWLEEEHISLEKEVRQEDNSLARFFPVTGGILKTMDKSASGYTYMALDGVDNCISALHDIENGKVHNCFIEMSACVGSCVGGPVMEKRRRSPVSDYVAVAEYAGGHDFNVPQPQSTEIRKVFEVIEQKAEIPTEEQIEDILHRMGKFTPADELNCGSCGYGTCREKAAAVFNGKAEISMCLPFLKERAEKFSDTISKNTPNGIVVVNEDLEVQQINPAALRLMNLKSDKDILGDNVGRILDVSAFRRVAETGRSIYNKRIYLAEYGHCVEQTVIPAEDGHQILCIMRDVTKEEEQKARKEEIGRQTVEVADKVVDKQMRIVQEIAALLGETAAETKIALAKLKESIVNE